MASKSFDWNVRNIAKNGQKTAIFQLFIIEIIFKTQEQPCGEMEKLSKSCTVPKKS